MSVMSKDEWAAFRANHRPPQEWFDDKDNPLSEVSGVHQSIATDTVLSACCQLNNLRGTIERHYPTIAGVQKAGEVPPAVSKVYRTIMAVMVELDEDELRELAEVDKYLAEKEQS